MKKIVVRLPNWIGDAIMATPFLRILTRLDPSSSFIGAAPPHILELLQGLPFFDETISLVDKKNTHRLLASLHADEGILLTGSFSSAYHFWQAGIPVRMGFSCHMRRLLLTHPIALPTGEELHDVQKYLRLLLALNPTHSWSKEEEVLSAKVLPAEIQAMETRLSTLGILPSHTLLVVHPGASYGEAKCWPKEYFEKALLTLTQDPSIRIILVGTSGQKELIDSLSFKSGTIFSLAGQTSLRELMALLVKAHCVLTNDSGPMHMAAALKVPLVALFGSTNPKRTAPWKWGKVLYEGVSCSPCYRRTCRSDFRCMRQLLPERVVDAVFEQLQTRAH